MTPASWASTAPVTRGEAALFPVIIEKRGYRKTGLLVRLRFRIVPQPPVRMHLAALSPTHRIDRSPLRRVFSLDRWPRLPARLRLMRQALLSLARFEGANGRRVPLGVLLPAGRLVGLDQQEMHLEVGHVIGVQW